MKRIVVADPSPFTRSALRLLLDQLADVDSVEEATTTDDCLAALARTTADILLLEWRLPGLTAAGPLLADVRREHPALLIVALSSRPEDGPEALAAGAHTFVSKGDAPEALLACLALDGATPSGASP